MDLKQANTRIAQALDKLRVMGWTTEQRERLVDGLYRDDAVEAAEQAVKHANNVRQQPYHANVRYDA